MHNPLPLSYRRAPAQGPALFFSCGPERRPRTPERMQDFKNLKVWHKSLEQLLDIYKTTEAFPPDERFRMTDQLRKAADSVKENIAEGCGKDGDLEFKRYVLMALGSQFEIESRLISTVKLNFLKPNDFDRLTARCHEIRRMLISLKQVLSKPRRIRRPPPPAPPLRPSL